jgi:hypothetical protein
VWGKPHTINKGNKRNNNEKIYIKTNNENMETALW